MKFVPVSRAIVSITTGSSTSLKSSWTRSSGFGVPPGAADGGGAATARGGGAGTGGEAVCAPAPATRSPAARPAKMAGAQRSNTLFPRAAPRRRPSLRDVIGEGTLAPVRALHGDGDAVRLGQLPQEVGALFRPVDSHAVETRHRVPVLDPDLLEHAARLHGVELHPDHVAVLILRQNVCLCEEGRRVSRRIFYFAACHREPVVGDALDPGPPGGRGRNLRARSLLEGELFPARPVFEDD